MIDHPPRKYAGVRRRGWRRPTLLLILAIGIPQLIVAGLLAAGMGMLPGRDQSYLANADARKPTGPLTPGDCVRGTDDRIDTSKSGDVGTAYLPISCKDHRAYGEVIAVVTGDATATEACTERTDFFATQLLASPSIAAQSAPIEEGDRATQVVCLRKTGDDHPGDPGRGGGIYRAGDCVTSSAETAIREVPCTNPAVFEVITARAKTVAECQPPADRFATLHHGSERILCLGDGPGIAGPGECIGDPQQTPVTFAVLTCSSEQAHAVVLSRSANSGDCRNTPGQSHYIEDPSGLPRSRVVCVKLQ